MRVIQYIKRKENMAVLTRTLEMMPVGDKAERDRIYTWIRSFMDAQSRMMNQYMSALFSLQFPPHPSHAVMGMAEIMPASRLMGRA